MRTLSTSQRHRLKAAFMLAAVSLPITLPLIASASSSLHSKSPTIAAQPPHGSRQGPAASKTKKETPEETLPALHINAHHTSKDGIGVQVVDVSRDSRCPTDVTCVWAGNAIVTLRLSRKGYQPATVQLNTYLQPKDVKYGGKKIELVSLTPYPKRPDSIARKDYAVTLKIMPVTVNDKAAPGTNK